MKAEQRQLRKQWLTEKGELGTKLSELNSLVTKHQATIIKKEKDFDKLQKQLRKLINDAQRNVKTTMIISKPLQKASSQNSTKVSLKDAESLAYQESIAYLEVFKKLFYYSFYLFLLFCSILFFCFNSFILKTFNGEDGKWKPSRSCE